MLETPHPRNSQERTIEVGFGALTGKPFGLTAARVPAASALRCSRWIWRGVSFGGG
jgi:hypothetical protein